MCFTAPSSHISCWSVNCHGQHKLTFSWVMQVRVQCQDRGSLLADLWAAMQMLVQASLADSKAAQVKSASCTASNGALQAAMPLLLAQHNRYGPCLQTSHAVKCVLQHAIELCQPRACTPMHPALMPPYVHSFVSLRWNHKILPCTCSDNYI